MEKDMEKYLTFVRVLADITDKCELVKEAHACEDCPFFEDHDKCLRWEENMLNISPQEFAEFIKFDYDDYFVDDYPEEDEYYDRPHSYFYPAGRLMRY